MNRLVLLAALPTLLLVGCTLFMEFRMPDGAAETGPDLEADPDVSDPGVEEADGPDDPLPDDGSGDDEDPTDREEAEPPVDLPDEDASDAPDELDAEEEEVEPQCGNAVVEEGEDCDPPGGDPSDCATSCGSTGSRICGEGCAWGECAPPDETCNGLDEDCTEGPDNGFPCVQGLATACTTECGSEGTGTCGADCALPDPGDCAPPDEACNGLDDDCDGDPDEVFECVLGTEGVPCVNPVGVAGTMDCDPACLWSPCCGAEDCGNGYDDNCDGAVDEPGRMGSQIRVTNDPALSARVSPVWTGSEIALAWHDTRDGATEIYLARTSALGEKIGSDVRITDSAGAASQPSLRWTGSELAAVWSDTRDGNAEIYFARISAAGDRIGDEVRITDDPGASTAATIQWTGSQFAVLWTDDRPGPPNSEIYLALISSSGEKVGDDLRLTDAPDLSEMPSLTWTGSRFGAAWKDMRDGDYEIYFALLSDAGVKEVGDVRITSAVGGSGSPSIHWIGARFALAWCDARDGTGAEIYYTSISEAGVKEMDDVRVTNAPELSSFPSMVWSGSELGVVWRDLRNTMMGEIYFTRLLPDGTRLGSDVRVSSRSGLCDFPALTWTGSRFTAAWHHDVAGNVDVYLALIGCM